MFSFFLSIIVFSLVVLGGLSFSLWRARIFHPATFDGWALDDLSAEVKGALRATLENLQRLGFEAKFALQAPASFDNTKDSWSVLCLSRDTKVMAVATAKIVGGKQTVAVVFMSALESGELVYTGNAPNFDVAGIPTDFLVELEAFASADEQRDAHLGQVATAESTARALSMEEAMFEYLQSHLRELDFLEGKGAIKKVTGSEKLCYRFCLLKLPILAVRSLVVAITSANKFNHSWSSSTAPIKEAWVASETHVREDVRWEMDDQMLMDLTEYKSQKLEGKNFGIWGKIALLLGSLVLMAVALTFMGFNSMADLLAVLVILFVHELGHFAMMKIFGYRGLTIFFIPFFGAAATGRKHLASAREEFWVLMMGPLPGFVAGLAILGAGYFHEAIPGWLLNAALLSVIINGFNLLPLTFLDGGRIADLLIFRRIPRLRIVFMIVMAVFSLGVAAISGIGLIGTLAVFGIIGLISERHLPKLIPFIRANVTEDMTESEAALQTMRLMRETHCHDAMSKPNWALKVDELIDWSLSKRMGFCETFAACGLHAVLLLFPFAALVGVGLYLGAIMGGGNEEIFAKSEEWHNKAVTESQGTRTEHGVIGGLQSAFAKFDVVEAFL